MNYYERVFLVESRILQLNNLKKLIERFLALTEVVGELETQTTNELEEMLEEMKKFLLKVKIDLMKEGHYTFVCFKQTFYEYGYNITYEMLDLMVFIFFSTIVKEFNISSYYDEESIEIINKTTNNPLIQTLSTSPPEFSVSATSATSPLLQTLSSPSSFPEFSVLATSATPLRLQNLVLMTKDFEKYLKLSVSHSNFNIWKKKRNQLFIPSEKYKFIKKVEMEKIVENVCGICINNHKKKEMVTLNCSHEFGKECFNGWMDICKNNSKELTCPSCRVETTELKICKQKGRRSGIM